jgi:hypothetical protein
MRLFIEKYWHIPAVAAVIIVHICLLAGFNAVNFYTYDEAVHMAGGVEILRGSDYDVNPESGVLPQAVAGLPLLSQSLPTAKDITPVSAASYPYSSEMIYGRPPLARKYLDLSRTAMSVFSILCALSVFILSRHIAGKIPALVATGGEFWRQGIGRHVVDRGLGAFDDRATIPIVFYLVTALFSLFPWLGRAGCAWEVLRHPRSDIRAAYLASWAAGPYLIFAFYATQLPHYVLPAFPALIITLFACENWRGSRWGRRWFLVYHGLFCALILFLAVLLLAGPVKEQVRGMMLGFVTVLAGLEIVAMCFEARRWVSLTAGLVAVAAGGWIASNGMREVALSPQIAALAAGCEGKLSAVGYTEPSLVYYSGRHWDMFPASPDGLAQAVAQAPDFLVVLRRQASTDSMLGLSSKAPRDTKYAALADDLDRQGYERIELSGLNIARFTWADVDLYRKLDARLAPE